MESSDFVAHMEWVLDIYKTPYDEAFPVVCMDESPKQLIRETRTSLPRRPGSDTREDYEYERCGVANIYMANEPLKGRRFVSVTETKKKNDWAFFIREIAEKYPDAKKIRLVMDNFGTHKAAALYETFSPEEAKRIWDRFEFIYTPKHGSWLNMAEIELHILMKQCLSRRMDKLETMVKEVKAWENDRNNRESTISWQFNTDQARIKLKKLYPTILD